MDYMHIERFFVSNFNVAWLQENLSEESVIFYIGAANLVETINIKKAFPKSIIHAFECSTYWIKDHPIIKLAKQNDIEYHQYAVSNIDGEISFYQSLKNKDEIWPVSSSIFEPTENCNFLSFAEPTTVQSIRLDTFCKSYNICPDFIHIDAQGAEYSIFSAIGNYRPKIIWTEISEFEMYKTGVKYNDFYNLLVSMGYKKLFTDGPDELYVLSDLEPTEYVPNKQQLENKKVTFVFKHNSHISPHNIHSPKDTFLYKMLDSFKMVENVYYSDNLPKENFIYEYQQNWELGVNGFFGENGFLELDPCPENVLQRIRDKTAWLIITMPFESPLQSHRIIKIHNYIKKQNLPPTQIIYMTGCLNGQELYELFCQSNNEKPVMNLEYLAENFFVHSDMAKTPVNIFKRYSTQPREKTFLMFNRRWLHHPHRTLFLYYLYKFGMLNDFFISFSKVDVDHQTHNYIDVLESHFSNFFKNDSYTSLTKEDLINLNNLLPLYLDTTDLHTSSLMFDKFKDTSKFYYNSFINIVGETYFYTSTTNILHLTEKTLKPILYKQPFIMLGPPLMLKGLQELGLKTFNDVWDESYDETLDHTERFFKVLNLCKEIHSWSTLEKQSAMEKCKNLVQHNFNFLLNFNKNKKLIYKFLNKYKIQKND